MLITMPENSKKEKSRFLRKWTLLNALTLIITYPIGLIIGFAFFTNPGYEWGSHFEQTRNVIIFQSVAGIIIGIVQWNLLKKRYKIPSIWIVTFPVSVIIVETFAGIICHKLNINRGDLSFLEGDSYSHALMMAITGLMLGIIQLPILNKHFTSTFYWPLATMFAWAISVLLTAITFKYEMMVLITFLLGSLLFGAITGAALIWALKVKTLKNES